MDGVLIVNKPISKSSFDMIRDVRKKYNTKKVGHIGTLDPMATGVLPVLVGKATKLCDYLMEHDKEYVATLQLGMQTSTGDSEGDVISNIPVSENIFDNNIIDNVLNSFLGEYFQIPPMYSAIKVNGKKLYELARSGQTIERTPRKVHIYEIEKLDILKNQNQISFRVVCSKGTYIRTLCEDIASKLDTCGYMSSLVRTRVGNFKIENADTFIELKDVLTDVPRIDVFDIGKLKNGIKLPAPHDLNSYIGLGNLYYNNSFLGICKIEKGFYKRFIIL